MGLPMFFFVDMHMCLLGFAGVKSHLIYFNTLCALRVTQLLKHNFACYLWEINVTNQGSIPKYPLNPISKAPLKI